MMPTFKRGSVLLLLVLASACGSSSTTPTPTPTPVPLPAPTPPPPTPAVLRVTASNITYNAANPAVPATPFKTSVTVTYSDISGSGANVNFLNVTWSSPALGPGGPTNFTDFTPAAFLQIWGTNHINVGQTNSVVAFLQTAQPFPVGSLAVLVQTSMQDDLGNVTNFGPATFFQAGVLPLSSHR